jgi:hypothetical protein
MSTNREPAVTAQAPPAAETRLVTLLSHWLARHVDDEELRGALGEIDATGLSPGQVEALDELKAVLAGPGESHGEREMIVRETLEALALGA